MLDMMHYNGRCICRMELIIVLFFGIIALFIYIFYQILFESLM